MLPQYFCKLTNVLLVLVAVTLSTTHVLNAALPVSSQTQHANTEFTMDPSAFEQVITAHFAKRKHINVMKYGAKADAKTDEACSTIAGSKILTCSDRAFAISDVGKIITVKGAAFNRRQFITIISGYKDPQHIYLRDSASETTSGTGVIWGSDNLFAFQTALNAAAGLRLDIPAGNFLLLISKTVQLEVPSGTAIFQRDGSTVYMVGVSGTPREDMNVRLFHLSEGTHDVLFYGLHCSGENLPYSITSMNQSECIGGLGVQPEALRDITILHSRFDDLYGFSIHDAGTGLRFSVVTSFFSHTSKGLNVNSDYSVQVNNSFEADAGMEASGSHSIYANNMLYNCTGQYAISLGGRTNLPNAVGSIAQGNVIDGLGPESLGGISVANGFIDGKVSDNRIKGLRLRQIGINLSHSDYPTTTDNNLIVGNEIVGLASSLGIIVGRGVHGTRLEHNRTTGTMYGAAFSGSGTQSRDNFWSGTFKDLSISAHGDEGRNISVQDDFLAHGIYEIHGQATVTSGSYFRQCLSDQEVPMVMGATSFR
jgi:hypothetical protein